MTPEDITRARETLGSLWGMDRPLKAAELGRMMRLKGRDPGESIRDYESGKTPVPGPVQVCIEMWLSGAEPPDLALIVKLVGSSPKAAGINPKDQTP